MASSNVVLQPGAAPSAPTIDFETTKEIGFYQLVWHRFRRRRIAVISISILALLALACAIGPILLPAEHVDPTHASLGPLQAGPVLGPPGLRRDPLGPHPTGR